MKITICGSMAFAKEMLAKKSELEERGHLVFVPDKVEDYLHGYVDKNNMTNEEGASRKIKDDLIRKHCALINNSDAVLILNYEKRGIPNYIGGNAFLEMGYAYILGKKIFLLNAIPDISLIRQEVEAMQPIIIYSNLSLIA